MTSSEHCDVDYIFLMVQTVERNVWWCAGKFQSGGDVEIIFARRGDENEKHMLPAMISAFHNISVTRQQ